MGGGQKLPLVLIPVCFSSSDPGHLAILGDREGRESGGGDSCDWLISQIHCVLKSVWILIKRLKVREMDFVSVAHLLLSLFSKPDDIWMGSTAETVLVEIK